MNSWWVKAVFIFIAVFVLLKFGPSVPVQSIVTQKMDSFTVSGEGKVTVVPDTGIVSLGITSNKPTVKAAQTEANTVIANITKAVKELGVADKDIKTSNYSVYPQYDYSTEGAGRINGYQVSANLTISVREIDKVNSVIDQATSNGANTVGGIQLTVDEDKQKELRQQARELAVKEAKTKAESLAKAAGITLGKIINVVESGNDIGPRPYDMMVANTKEGGLGGGGGAPTEINPGSTDISTSVTLFYETR